MFQVNDYRVHRKDGKFNQLSKIRGGGVLLAVKNYIRSESLLTHYTDSYFPEIDLLVGKLELDNVQVYVLTIYILDVNDLDKFDKFFEYLEKLKFMNTNKFLILGMK